MATRHQDNFFLGWGVVLRCFFFGGLPVSSVRKWKTSPKFEGKLGTSLPFSTSVMGRRVSLVNLLDSENLPDAPKRQTNKATGLKNSELVHLCTSYPSLWERKTCTLWDVSKRERWFLPRVGGSFFHFEFVLDIFVVHGPRISWL